MCQRALLTINIKHNKTQIIFLSIYTAQVLFLIWLFCSFMGSSTQQKAWPNPRTSSTTSSNPSVPALRKVKAIISFLKNSSMIAFDMKEFFFYHLRWSVCQRFYFFLLCFWICNQKAKKKICQSSLLKIKKFSLSKP